MQVKAPNNESARPPQELRSLPYRLRIYRLVRKLLLGFIFISIINGLFSYFFYTPKMYRINRENRDLVIRYHILQDKMRSLEREMEEIAHRDNYVYRPLFSTDPLQIEGIETPYPESKYAPLKEDIHSSLMISTWKQMDRMARELYARSLSLDELQNLSKNKERLSTAIPALWPIDRSLLRNGIDPFGWRIHPIYHQRIFHKGVDLPGNVGDPVYATGDAVVESIDERNSRKGYGRQVLLDHQFGYKTRYAHLSKVLVKPGEKIVRGQLIGELGRSGGVTGPHLHYEVIHQGQVVNPINYFNKNMTPEEYERIMAEVREQNLEKFEK
ncbi:MAG: M23 family metallopeptidase [Rikenellaceae bacterium]|nr:M23 family metallopeptidase [Rikenellaceae bacterium]